MSWLAFSGNVQVSNVSMMVVNSSVSASSSSGDVVVSIGWLADGGNVQVSHASVAAINSNFSASSSGGTLVVSMGWLAYFGDIQVSNASVVAVHSLIEARTIRSVVLAIAAGAFSGTSTLRLVTVTGLSFRCCNVTIFSSENALTVVTRAFNGPRFGIVGTPQVSSFWYQLFNTTVITQSVAPHGDCLTTPPSGSLPSVIINSTLRCNGSIGPSIGLSPSQLFVSNSDTHTRFAGANTTFVPEVDCSVELPDITGFIDDRSPPQPVFHRTPSPSAVDTSSSSLTSSAS
ncbi:MAG: hypothetical protein Q8J97_01365, partial [Flavobacteriaceae bacterium]|nr:hypothetical protein [Flavobacteriaceae bacterium]